MTAEPPKVVVFGELLLRLNPRASERIVQAGEFEVRYTGAEANVAALLAGFGLEAYVVSKVPAHEIGEACVGYLRRFGIKTDHIARGGERLGIFYLETGAAQRASKVIYDREHAAIREIRPSDIDWDSILSGADWFHFSGTAPALGENVRVVLRSGLLLARERGVRVSCDLNYRAKLWGTDEAREVMTDLMTYVDVLIGNEEDSAKVFGLVAEGSDVTKGELIPTSYEQVAMELSSRFGLAYVATTLRRSVSASVNHWAGLLFDGQRHYSSRSYEISPVIDRVGAGDCFAGGLIYSMLRGFDPQACVEFAVAASCLKHSIPGDFGLVSLEEIEILLAGDASGRVRR
jgi:2-dehydro-3-deoxygluconokinase